MCPASFLSLEQRRSGEKASSSKSNMITSWKDTKKGEWTQSEIDKTEMREIEEVSTSSLNPIAPRSFCYLCSLHISLHPTLAHVSGGEAEFNDNEDGANEGTATPSHTHPHTHTLHPCYDLSHSLSS